MSTTKNTTENGSMTDPERYWNRAGEVGYTEAMYYDGAVGDHIKGSIRASILDASEKLGLNKNSRILELGCGDGDLANHFLSHHFKSIEAHDLAPAGINRANQFKQPNTSFFCTDITKMNFEAGVHYDAVFFIGILHHVKSATPSIIEKISYITDHVVVMEPNGNHIGRKLLEQLPYYKRAGEDSFRKKELVKIFARAGFRETYFKRFNLLPNFIPKKMFDIFKRFEPTIEKFENLDFLCTNQIFAFKKVSKK